MLSNIYTPSVGATPGSSKLVGLHQCKLPCLPTHQSECCRENMEICTGSWRQGTISSEAEKQTSVPAHTASRPIHLTSKWLICPSYSPGTGRAPAAGHWSIPPGPASAVGLCGCTLWSACPVSCVMIPPQVSLASGKSPGAVHWSCWPSSPPPPLTAGTRLSLGSLTPFLSPLTKASLQPVSPSTS